MKEISKKRLLSWDPCYTEEMIDDHFGSKKKLSVDDILKKRISLQDKLWVISRMVTPSDRRKIIEELKLPYITGLCGYSDEKDKCGYSDEKDKQVLNACVKYIRREEK